MKNPNISKFLYTYVRTFERNSLLCDLANLVINERRGRVLPLNPNSIKNILKAKEINFHFFVGRSGLAYGIILDKNAEPLDCHSGPHTINSLDLLTAHCQ